MDRPGEQDNLNGRKEKADGKGIGREGSTDQKRRAKKERQTKRKGDGPQTGWEGKGTCTGEGR